MIGDRWRRRAAPIIIIIVGALLVAACAAGPPRAAHTTSKWPSDRPSAAAARATGEREIAAAAVKRYRSVRTHETTAPPVSVRMPSIGVSSDLQRLGRNADGTIEVPDDWQRAGWFHDGPKPGQVGPAVILGHVDSTAGPAVFYRLRELQPGDEVHVHRADGTTVTFVVQRSEWHAKTRFPTHRVYLPTLRPTIRLVTCGGPFDEASGHYRDNLVVFATLEA